MLQSLRVALGWNPLEPFEPGQRFLLGDCLEANGSVMIPDIVSFYLNQLNFPVLMISFCEPLEAFLSLYRRLGMDLNLLSATESFAFINGVGLLDHSLSVEGLLSSVQEFLDKNQGKRCLVILNDPTSLLSIGLDISRVLNILLSIEKVLGSKMKLDMLVYTHYDTEDYGILWRWLIHWASQLLIIKPLSTGISREWHAQVPPPAFNL